VFPPRSLTLACAGEGVRTHARAGLRLPQSRLSGVTGASPCRLKTQSLFRLLTLPPFFFSRGLPPHCMTQRTQCTARALGSAGGRPCSRTGRPQDSLATSVFCFCHALRTHVKTKHTHVAATHTNTQSTHDVLGLFLQITAVISFSFVPKLS